jgi:hypothetical protein
VTRSCGFHTARHGIVQLLWCDCYFLEHLEETMGFLKKLFGSQKQTGQKQAYVDTRGIYFYVRCERCGTMVRLRADKEYDLIPQDGGYVWHKTIVDNRCFRPMATIVTLDGSFQVTAADLTGGRYVTREEYEAWYAEQAAQKAAATDKEE